MTWARIPAYPRYQAHRSGKVRNAETKRLVVAHKANGYNRVGLYVDGKKTQKQVQMSHCILRAFVGPPPTSSHTADHIDPSRRGDDSLRNLRWATKSEQIKNQRKRVRERKKTPVIQTQPDGTETRYASITDAAKETGIWLGNISKCVNGDYKTAGGSTWRFDEAPDLDDEVWTPHPDHAKIAFSNFGRVRDSRKPAYVSIRAASDYRTTRGAADNAYPGICIDGRKVMLHILAAETFLGPRPYGKVVDHVDNDRTDIRPEKLRYLTVSENRIAATETGCCDSANFGRRTTVFEGVTYASRLEAARKTGVCPRSIFRRMTI